MNLFTISIRDGEPPRETPLDRFCRRAWRVVRAIVVLFIVGGIADVLLTLGH